MKVYNLKTRKLEDYNDSYAARLIEHGAAVLPKPAKLNDEPTTNTRPKDDAKPKDGTKGKASKAGGK